MCGRHDGSTLPTIHSHRKPAGELWVRYIHSTVGDQKDTSISPSISARPLSGQGEIDRGLRENKLTVSLGASN